MRIPPMRPRDDRPAGEQGFVSLRDTFAAAALTGLLANDDLCAGDDKLSRMAYDIADAMLRERNGAVEGCEKVRLTDEEREAVEAAIFSCEVEGERFYTATLRKLLERLK